MKTSHKRLDILFPPFLVVIAILTRIPLASRVLFDWDAVNYALALTEYNVSKEQPHPPGYILYVALGKASNLFFPDANTSYVAVSILFGALTLPLLYLLAKAMYGRDRGVVSALFLLVSPLFWFYGEVTSPYILLAFSSTLVAYTCFQAIKGNVLYLYLSSIAVGLAGGLRPDLLVFLFPLWLYALWVSRRSWKDVFAGFLLLGISTLSWLVPAMILVGGVRDYLNLYHSQISHYVSWQSPVVGAGNLFYNALILLTCTGVALGFLFPLLVYPFFRLKKNLQIFLLINERKNQFLAIWILPSFLFYLLGFLGKPGHVLIYIPGLFILLADWSLNLFEIIAEKIGTVKKSQWVIGGICFAVVLNLLVSLVGVYYFIKIISSKIYDIKAIENKFEPSKTLIVSGLQDSYGRYFKASYYYLFKYRVIMLDMRKREGEERSGLEPKYYYQARNHLSRRIDSAKIRINPELDHIIWLIDYWDPSWLKPPDLKEIIFPWGSTFYLQSTNDLPETFRYGEYQFVKER